jgi:tetratricopeptide (TPR) repeat protein
LFLERANRVRDGFEPNDVERALITGIVRRLDGVPLAIELAAGRLASLSLADLAARLDRALDLLSGATETGDDRHANLRAAIGWSYELLPAGQQRLFRNLAIFPDGFDLVTAEAVASEVAASVDPTSAVAHLVDASMLEATLGDVPRYRMLDTLRSFGLDRLAAHQEHEAAMARFLQWARSFSRWVDDTTLTADEPLADRRLLTELGNLRAAWHYARSADDLDVMADLVISLDWPAQSRDLTEIMNWAVELARHPHLFEHSRVASVLAIASDARWQSLGDLDGARSLAKQGLSVASEHDPLARQRGLVALGDVRLFEGRFEEAVELFLESGQGTPWHETSSSVAALARAYGARLGEARVLNSEVAGATCPSVLAFHHYVAGEIDNLEHAWTAAELHYEEALRLSELSGAAFIHALTKVGLVSVHAASGDTQAALRGYGELIDYWATTGGWTQQWTTLRNLADLLDQLEDHDCAAMLRRAAAEAPEAASTAAVSTLEAAMAGDEIHQTRPARAAALAREQALDAARSAITRHLTTTGN